MPRSILRPILVATLVAGTLDILAAVGLTPVSTAASPPACFATSPPARSRRATGWGTGGAALGLAVHFAIMAVDGRGLRRRGRAPAGAARGSPLLWGVLYGLATYVVMNLIVVPLRFAAPLPPSTRAIATQLFCHIVLVGIPIALIAARHFRHEAPSPEPVVPRTDPVRFRAVSGFRFGDDGEDGHRAIPERRWRGSCR